MQLNSCCKNLREKLHRIHTASVDPRFQMQVTACHPPGMSDIADNLPRLYLLTGRHADGRTVGVQRFQSAAVVDLDVVTVAAAPTVKAVGNSDHAICGGEDWRTLGAGNVGAGVGTDLAGDGVNTVGEKS